VRPEAAHFAIWRREPWTYVRQVLKAEPDKWQDECLHALIESGYRRFALKACKGPGKSTLLAWVMWWFLTCFPHAKILCCSITGENLQTGLWAELGKWRLNSRMLQAAFEFTSDLIYERNNRDTWFIIARTIPPAADPQKQADTLAGAHGDFIMLVVDESGGVKPAVLAAADAVLANADENAGRVAYVLQAGNPTDLRGALYQACTLQRAIWWVKEITADPDAPDRATRVNIQWAREQIASYPGGREHPWVMVNVLGKWPPGQSNALISVDDAVSASKRKFPREVWMPEPRIMGIDVARFGDDESVFAYRQGRVAFKMKCYRNLDLMGLVGNAANSINRWKPHAVFVDVTGLGAGVVDRLKELGFRVTGVEFGGKSVKPGFMNRRAEMWKTLADWVPNGCIPEDPQLISELPAPTYGFHSDGRLKLEAKEDMKKRGVPSPNRADALALTFAAPVPHAELRELADRSISHSSHDYDPYAIGGAHAATVDRDPYAAWGGTP
jgi:phage terminase large subunit